MQVKIIMPEMGEGIIEGTVSRWLKSVGDQVEEFEPILEIETDKVTTEAVAESSGTLTQILVEDGATVAVGTELGVITADVGEFESVPAPPSPSQPVIQASEPASSPTNGATTHLEPAQSPTSPFYPSRKTDVGWVSPVVARMAAEHKLDLTRVTGTGRNGRITKRDVQAFIEKAVVQSPVPPSLQIQTQAQELPHPAVATVPAARSHSPSTPDPLELATTDELLPLTNMRRLIADHMVESKRTSPHATTVFEVDFHHVAAHRQAHKAAFAAKGIKLTFTAYLVAAVAQALQIHPMVNSSWSDQGILLHKSINIGMAAAVDNGLVVPVIEHAGDLNLQGTARIVNDLSGRARNNKLAPTELRGGTFTITNHGVSGSLFATPIINQPQCGILGVGAIQKRVVVVDDMIAIRPMAYLSFSFDHRILDGVTADNFVAHIKNTLESYAS